MLSHPAPLHAMSAEVRPWRPRESDDRNGYHNHDAHNQPAKKLRRPLSPPPSQLPQPQPPPVQHNPYTQPTPSYTPAAPQPPPSNPTVCWYVLAYGSDSCSAAHGCRAQHVSYRQAWAESLSLSPPQRPPMSQLDFTTHFQPMLFETPPSPYHPLPPSASASYSAVLPVPVTSQTWQCFHAAAVMDELLGSSGLGRTQLSVILGADEWSADSHVGQYGFVVLSGEKEAVQRGMAAVISIADRCWTFASHPQPTPPASSHPYPTQTPSSAPYTAPAPVAAAKPPPLLPYPTAGATSAAAGPSVREREARPLCYRLLGCESRTSGCPCEHDYAAHFARQMAPFTRPPYRNWDDLPAVLDTFTPTLSASRFVIPPASAWSTDSYIACLPIPCRRAALLAIVGSRGARLNMLQTRTGIRRLTYAFQAALDNASHHEQRRYTGLWLEGPKASVDAMMDACFYLLTSTEAEKEAGLDLYMERFQLDRPAALPQDVWFSLSSRGLSTAVLSPSNAYSAPAPTPSYPSTQTAAYLAAPSYPAAISHPTSTAEHYSRPPPLLTASPAQPYYATSSSTSSSSPPSSASSPLSASKHPAANGSGHVNGSVESVCYLFHLCTQPACRMQHTDYARVFADQLIQGQPRHYRDTRNLPSVLSNFTPILAESSHLLWDSSRSRADWLLCIPLPAVSAVCKSFIGRQGSTRDVLFGLSKVSWATIAGSALDQLDSERLVASRQWVCLWVGGTRQACDVWLECALYCMSHRCLSAVLSGREREDLDVHIEQFKRQWNSARPVNGCPLLAITSRGYATPRYGSSG